MDSEKNIFLNTKIIVRRRVQLNFYRLEKKWQENKVFIIFKHSYIASAVLCKLVLSLEKAQYYLSIFPLHNTVAFGTHCYQTLLKTPKTTGFKNKDKRREHVTLCGTDLIVQLLKNDDSKWITHSGLNGTLFSHTSSSALLLQS